jgi:hypothetical protein
VTASAGSPDAADINLHHLYITRPATRRYSEQAGEEKTAYLSGSCNLMQTLVIPFVFLVTGAGQRFEPARRFYVFTAKPMKTESSSHEKWGLCLQYVSSRFSKPPPRVYTRKLAWGTSLLDPHRLHEVLRLPLESKAEAGALTEAAHDIDLSAVRLDEALGYRQPKTCPGVISCLR